MSLTQCRRSADDELDRQHQELHGNRQGSNKTERAPPTAGKSTANPTVGRRSHPTAPSKTGGRARKEAILTTTCDHSLCARKGSSTMTTRNPSRPSTQENASIHGKLEDMYPSRCSFSEFHEFGNLFRRPRAGAWSSLLSPSCFVTRPHQRNVRMSPEVQDHRPASPKGVFFQKNITPDSREKSMPFRTVNKVMAPSWAMASRHLRSQTPMADHLTPSVDSLRRFLIAEGHTALSFLCSASRHMRQSGNSCRRASCHSPITFRCRRWQQRQQTLRNLKTFSP